MISASTAPTGKCALFRPLTTLECVLRLDIRAYRRHTHTRTAIWIHLGISSRYDSQTLGMVSKVKAKRPSNSPGDQACLMPSPRRVSQGFIVHEGSSRLQGATLTWCLEAPTGPQESAPKTGRMFRGGGCLLDCFSGPTW